jgi:glycosyltransferase involved in cell wall biosynthesis
MIKPQWVSIVIPCFNHEAYIEESIRSVVAQAYDKIELVVINDGSTDNSFAVISALQDEYGFTVIDQQNQGLTRAVDAGFQCTTGEFFMSFDADDVMLPGRIERQVAYLNSHPDAGCCGANFQFIDSQGGAMSGAPFKKAASYAFKDIFEAEEIWLGAPTSLYRRQAVLDAGGYDLDNKIQDYPMELQVAHAGYTLDVIEDVVTSYRRHGNNMSLNYKANLPYYLMAIDKYKGQRGYGKARRAVLHGALKKAVIEDKQFAKELFKQLPLYTWNMKTIRRFRHYLTK